MKTCSIRRRITFNLCFLSLCSSLNGAIAMRAREDLDAFHSLNTLTDQITPEIWHAPELHALDDYFHAQQFSMYCDHFSTYLSEERMHPLDEAVGFLISSLGIDIRGLNFELLKEQLKDLHTSIHALTLLEPSETIHHQLRAFLEKVHAIRRLLFDALIVITINNTPHTQHRYNRNACLLFEALSDHTRDVVRRYCTMQEEFHTGWKGSMKHAIHWHNRHRAMLRRHFLRTMIVLAFACPIALYLEASTHEPTDTDQNASGHPLAVALSALVPLSTRNLSYFNALSQFQALITIGAGINEFLPYCDAAISQEAKQALRDVKLHLLGRIHAAQQLLPMRLRLLLGHPDSDSEESES